MHLQLLQLLRCRYVQAQAQRLLAAESKPLLLAEVLNQHETGSREAARAALFRPLLT